MNSLGTYKGVDFCDFYEYQLEQQKKKAVRVIEKKREGKKAQLIFIYIFMT
jgi:hypothetical protein